MNLPSRRKILINVLGILWTLLLWCVGQWTNPINEIPEYIRFLHIEPIYDILLYPHRNLIAIFSAILVILSITIITFFPSSRKEKLFAKEILNHIMKEKFNGHKSRNRLTIFEVKFGFLIILPYIWNCLVRNLITHIQCGLFLYYLKGIPRPFTKYLVMFARKGIPYERGSSTIFKVPQCEQDVDGFISHVWLLGLKDSARLPKLEREILLKYNSLTEIEDNDQDLFAKVIEFMSLSRIKSFQRLKALHRLSRNLWAAPIGGNEKDQWGVFALDNIDEESPFDKKMVLDEDMICYSKIILAALCYARE